MVHNRKLLLRNKIIALLIIIVITSISYSNSLKNGFTNWDDNELITDNNDITKLSTDKIANIFSSSYGAMYIPLTIISFAFEYKLFGLNPFYYHLNNLILHLLNCILVFYLIFLVTERKRFGDGSINAAHRLIIPTIVALFFGIHPMHVESVAWVTGRKDLLYSLFFLLGLITYIYYLQKRKLVYLFYTYLLFLLSLLSKSAAVSFPLILVLIDYYLMEYKEHKFFDIKYWFKKLPFFIISLMFGLIAIYFQRREGDLTDIVQFSGFDRIFIVFYSLAFYVVKLFIPNELCAIHLYPVKIDNVLPIEYYLSVPFIIGMILAISLIKSREIKKDMIFGTLFFLITISLVLRIIPASGVSITAERFTYVPYIGLMFAVGSVVQRIYWAGIMNKLKIKFLKTSKFVFVLIFIFIVSLFSSMTYKRNKIWADTISLFTDVIEKYPYFATGYNNISKAYLDKKEYELAIKYANDAVKLDSNLDMAYNNLGYAYFCLNDYDKAFAFFEKAVNIDPNLVAAFVNRSLINLELQKYDEVIEDCKRAILLEPNNALAYNNLGYAYFCKMNYEMALENLNMAIKIKNNFEIAYINRSITYFNLGRYEETIADCESVININPYNVKAYINLGTVYYSMGDFNKALTNFNHAIRLDPLLDFTYINRGKTYYMLGKYEKAIDNWETAIRLNSANEEVLRNLIIQAENI